VHTHRADCTQLSEDSNLCKQRKHGNRAQTELARRYGQGKCRKVQGMRTRWICAGMAHAYNEHLRAHLVFGLVESAYKRENLMKRVNGN